MIWSEEEVKRAARLARNDPDAPHPYIRILVGAIKGHGVRLSADEVGQMAEDDAIARILEPWLEELEDELAARKEKQP